LLCPLPIAGAGRAAPARGRRARPGAPGPAGGYAFEGHAPLRVSFPCPTCHQRIRVPVRGRLRARCALCRSELDCDT
ncbi:hypothetical protein ABZ637_23235, partial [Streptomyces sp. NPDC007100]